VAQETPSDERPAIEPVSSFSGGWRMRLNLARALICRSDLLLLDEPTNHLDLDAVIWLEGWLRRYPGTLLLISHDREFLDAVTDHIAHIEQQRLTLYSGNYSAFERIRAERLAHQQAQYQKQQREIAHMHSYVERFRAKATKARQAQSRLKALERMERIAPAHVDSPFHFGFRPPEKLPNPLLRLHRVACGYDGNAIVSGVELSLSPGDRIGLLGPNGAGKSTFIKLLAGKLQPLEGQVETAQVQIGPELREQEARDYLGSFGFSGDKALEPVAPFSGGEKSRLALALLIWKRPNLLLLDEPTNHLDLEMRQALAVALQDFTGAMIVVSHDRHLLRVSTDLARPSQQYRRRQGRRARNGQGPQGRAPRRGPTPPGSAAAEEETAAGGGGAGDAAATAGRSRAAACRQRPLPARKQGAAQGAAAGETGRGQRLRSTGAGLDGGSGSAGRGGIRCPDVITGPRRRAGGAAGSGPPAPAHALCGDRRRAPPPAACRAAAPGAGRHR